MVPYVSDDTRRGNRTLANWEGGARVFSLSERDDPRSLFSTHNRIRVRMRKLILQLLVRLASLMYHTPFRERVNRCLAQRTPTIPVEAHSQNPEPLIKLLR